MPFQPQVNQDLVISGTRYRIAGHPMAPMLPYGQEGRMATVYKLNGPRNDWALKVFKALHRKPEIASLATRLQAYASLPGLGVCQRSVLEPGRQGDLLREEPDLSYAVVMPWVEGVTWMDMITGDERLTQRVSLDLGRAFVRLMSGIEKAGVSHCDLSGPNLLIEEGPGTRGIFLVDVEQLYAPDLDQPSLFLVGTPGYGHLRDPDALWGPYADRFSGAILLCEILTWNDPTIRGISWGESYFDPEEMHRGTKRFEIMHGVLQRLYGAEVSDGFLRVWQSQKLAECPSLQEWCTILRADEPAPVQVQKPSTPEPRPLEETQVESPPQSVGSKTVAPNPEALLQRAAALESAGRIEQAINHYERVQEVTPTGSILNSTATMKINTLTLQQLTQDYGQETVVAPPGPDPTAVRQGVSPTQRGGGPQPAEQVPSTPVQRYEPGGSDAKRYGGLTRGQFIAALIGIPILAALFMVLAAQFLEDTAVWHYVSLPAFLGPALYGAFRRKWLTLIIYVPIVFLGGLVVSSIDPLRLFILILAGGLIMELLAQLGALLIKDPFRQWPLDLIWMATAGMLTGLFIEELGYTGIDYLTPGYILVNLLVGAVGWLAGRYLYQVIIILREQTG